MTPPAADRVLPALLLALTVVTGFVDAVSYLALGHVFTANMTGNVVFLAFAIATAPGLSIGRSGAALGAFVIGAIIGAPAGGVGALPGAGIGLTVGTGANLIIDVCHLHHCQKQVDKMKRAADKAHEDCLKQVAQ